MFFVYYFGFVVVLVYVGWCGFVVGVVEVLLYKMGVLVNEVWVWLGLVIGLLAFEVGEDVCLAFMV